MMEEMQVDKRIIKTKNKLKTALVSLLQTKKIDEVSILELTELANINRKTFYLHYKSIPDVLKDIEKNSIVAGVPAKIIKKVSDSNDSI